MYISAQQHPCLIIVWSLLAFLWHRRKIHKHAQTHVYSTAVCSFDHLYVCWCRCIHVCNAVCSITVRCSVYVVLVLHMYIHTIRCSQFVYSVSVMFQLFSLMWCFCFPFLCVHISDPSRWRWPSVGTLSQSCRPLNQDVSLITRLMLLYICVCSCVWWLYFQSVFSSPLSVEPIRPIDPSAWVMHTNQHHGRCTSDRELNWELLFNLMASH